MKTDLIGSIIFFLLASSLFSYGCGTSGKNFDETKFNKIIAGTTTKKEIHHMFGAPFKKGIQNGYPVWTYEYNYYNSLGNDITKDIVIVFDSKAVVKSRQMMTNRPEAIKQ